MCTPCEKRRNLLEKLIREEIELIHKRLSLHEQAIQLPPLPFNVKKEILPSLNADLDVTQIDIDAYEKLSRERKLVFDYVYTGNIYNVPANQYRLFKAVLDNLPKNLKSILDKEKSRAMGKEPILDPENRDLYYHPGTGLYGPDAADYDYAGGIGPALDASGLPATGRKKEDDYLFIKSKMGWGPCEPRVIAHDQGINLAAAQAKVAKCKFNQKCINLTVALLGAKGNLQDIRVDNANFYEWDKWGTGNDPDNMITGPGGMQMPKYKYDYPGSVLVRGTKAVLDYFLPTGATDSPAYYESRFKEALGKLGLADYKNDDELLAVMTIEKIEDGKMWDCVNSRLESRGGILKHIQSFILPERSPMPLKDLSRYAERILNHMENIGFGPHTQEYQDFADWVIEQEFSSELRRKLAALNPEKRDEYMGMKMGMSAEDYRHHRAQIAALASFFIPMVGPWMSAGISFREYQQYMKEGRSEEAYLELFFALLIGVPEIKNLPYMKSVINASKLKLGSALANSNWRILNSADRILFQNVAKFGTKNITPLLQKYLYRRYFINTMRNIAKNEALLKQAFKALGPEGVRIMMLLFEEGKIAEEVLTQLVKYGTKYGQVTGFVVGPAVYTQIWDAHPEWRLYEYKKQINREIEKQLNTKQMIDFDQQWQEISNEDPYAEPEDTGNPTGNPGKTKQSSAGDDIPKPKKHVSKQNLRIKPGKGKVIKF